MKFIFIVLAHIFTISLFTTSSFASVSSLAITDHLLEARISNGAKECDTPDWRCPALTYQVIPSTLNPKSQKLLVLDVYLADCFDNRGVYSYWMDFQNLRFFYSIGLAGGSACSSTAVDVKVTITTMMPGNQIIFLNQTNGLKTSVEYEGYEEGLGTDKEYKIRNVVIKPDQN